MAPDPTGVLLRNLSIWDGDSLAAGDAIAIVGERIAAIGEGSDLAKDDRFAALPQRDCAGLTAIPGLIDAHVHLELNPDRSKPPEGSQDHQAPLMAERAARMVAAGITTARDLGAGAWRELKLRDAIAAGEQVGPRLLCAGQPITTPTGHCHFWGGGASCIEEAHAVLHRQVARGVDLIKVMATGGRMTHGSEPGRAQFDVATLRAIVDEAARHHLTVAAHCHGTQGIDFAAQAGVRTIEHCSWVGPEGWASDYQEDIAKVILERGVWISPTVNRGWQRMLDAPKGIVVGRVRKAYQAMMALGIPFIASTDAGIPGVYHQDLRHALIVFAKIAELSAAATLRSATRDSARALGIADRCGTLRTGLAADVLLAHGNPAEDLTALLDLAAVWARGREIEPLNA
ncbi:MAG: amidohydrolase family protein [Pseudomonadota bacterium]